MDTVHFWKEEGRKGDGLGLGRGEIGCSFFLWKIVSVNASEWAGQVFLESKEIYRNCFECKVLTLWELNCTVHRAGCLMLASCISSPRGSACRHTTY